MIPSLAAVHGGPSTALLVFERVLTEAGFEVETATTDDDGPGRRLPRPGSVVENGVRRHYFPKQTQFYTASAPFARWIARHARDYDLVHVHALFSHVSTSAALAARRSGVPYVISPCGTLTAYGLSSKPLMKRISLRLFERRALRDAAAVHCTSERERDEALRTRIPMRARIVPIGIEPAAPGDAERFVQKYPTMRGRPRLLFLSRLHPVKNLEALIEALADLGSGSDAPALMVCGSGEPDYEAALRRRAEALGVGGRIAWTGFVEGREKADALAAADLFVLPSRSENFGVAAAEALAAGVPCVVGRGVALAPEIEAAGAGVAVEPDPASLRDAIQGLLESPERPAMSAAARRLAAERFSTEAMGRALADLYRTMIAGVATPPPGGHR